VVAAIHHQVADKGETEVFEDAVSVRTDGESLEWAILLSLEVNREDFAAAQ